jgi:DNA-binding response OmpR family regulator
VPQYGSQFNFKVNDMTFLPSDILHASILIVDDQQSMVTLLEDFLRDAGYRNVTSTINPREVLALHRKSQYDLILLDLHMPDMDGFEVMAALNGNEVASYLPVIVLTAQLDHKVRALQCGAKDFISKPFDLVEVRTRIYNMLEVRLLYKALKKHNAALEQTVQERTAELQRSEARYRCLTELAIDWYWEQDEAGNFTKAGGLALDMLGVPVGDWANQEGYAVGGWDEGARAELKSRIAARQLFLDFVMSRVGSNGSQQRYRVSGEPMFNRLCHYIGYRGIGVECTASM